MRASWQAYLAVWLLKWRMKSKLDRIRDVHEARAMMAQNPTLHPKDVRITPGTEGGVPVERLALPALPDDAPILLYLHGGGFIGCSPTTHRPITAAFARAGFAVVAPDYRLAPEHPFPAALEDAVAVFRALRARGTPAHRIVIAGDSAGGGLAVSLLLALRDEGEALPAAAGLFSPWTDLAATGASMQENDRKDAMFNARFVPDVAAIYLAGADPRTPLASPLYADLSNLPLLHIHAGEDEVLRDDATRLAERAGAAGTPVELTLWPVVPHAFPIVHFLPEAKSAMRHTSQALLQAIGHV